MRLRSAIVERALKKVMVSMRSSITGFVALILASALSAPLMAQDRPASKPLTAEEFDAQSVGKTLFYNSGGQAYGIEQYLPGRRVRWAFIGDQCMVGHWYQEGAYICFVYETDLNPQCWTFYATPDGLQARFRDDPEGAPLVAVEESREPLACQGPDLGV